MREAPGLLQEAQPEAAAAPELLLLISPEPWSRNFLQNLRSFFRPPEVDLDLKSAPADFWPDVFVDRPLPWPRFAQSAAYHALALVLIWAGSRFLALQPHITSQPSFNKADVIYYTPSEYLPPLDTRLPDPAPASKADPEYSAQPIISVPREADNRSQTLVTAPAIELHRDVPLPNVIAWSGKPQLPIGPAPAVPVSEITRLAPRIDHSVIAPPPDLQDKAQRDVPAASRQTLPAPQAAVIAPPPAIEADSARRPGDVNIGHSTVIAPAPQLSLDEQRTLPSRNSAALGRRAGVIAPPPALGSAGGSRSGGQMVALSLHPAVGAPPAPPAGNRRGTFAATPEGRRGASGTPGGNAGSGKESGSGSGSKNSNGMPEGLYVGKTSSASSPVAGPAAPAPTTNSVNPNLIANARPPRMTRTLQPESDSKLSDVERAVFGNRKFYSLSLNMPNLNSAGGSWIIRFAALKDDSASASPASRAAAAGDPSSSTPSADLSAPAATRKVDPAYPLELMKQNVGGTVILYAVIHADGTVGNVRVLRSVDDRLDQFASEAIAKWHFEPATKNGAPVDVEATFWIPFRPGKPKSSF